MEADRKTGKKLKGSIPLVKTERVTLENPRLLIHNPGRVRGSFSFCIIIPFIVSDIYSESGSSHGMILIHLLAREVNAPSFCDDCDAPAARPLHPSAHSPTGCAESVTVDVLSRISLLTRVNSHLSVGLI